MNGRIMGLFAETSIHPGQGKQQGILDLPVARESWTEYPYIPGSAVKGAFREKAVLEEFGEEKINQVFGEKTRAGEMGFSDARLLLLPVRSLNGHYYWVTCPYLIERFQRDLEMIEEKDFHLGDEEWVIKPSHAWVSSDLKAKWISPNQAARNQIYLEEFTYELIQRPEIDEVGAWIRPLIKHPSVRKRVSKQLVVISDDEFQYFAKFTLPIQTKNRLNKKKTSESLWQEENLPPDTLMYVLLMPRLTNSTVCKDFFAFVGERPYLKIGGNETTGLGWFATQFWAKEDPK
ncbi:type III-B CRISPR module RAMP protein Cmr4 [Thermoflavimicrobium dichotomicum]|uniref:CRISPR-associated protein Cmr4 n=1 Tax=Thermoflavimicrobium dichotomicum TaxID=46223 RepID=A0A1I3T6M6_9BACL|nr:type III-B CRISPR module RAMP protein Cmr4 [Thermoflavimicrobium dichotomicum]SFJ66260.1 CRISPR-associated protein Cmr4 [Thermoflavimicrobium dichotomicum]